MQGERPEAKNDSSETRTRTNGDLKFLQEYRPIPVVFEDLSSFVSPTGHMVVGVGIVDP
jgi:hypothetical protein